MSKHRPFVLPAFLGLLALASAASAQTFPNGAGNLAGADLLRVPGCGRDGGLISIALTAEPFACILGGPGLVAPCTGGAWTASTGAASYAGTGDAINERLARLTLDAASLAALEAALEAKASALCEEAVTISSLTANAALKVNKRQTHAWLGLRARARGMNAGGDEGIALYALRARGPWQTPQP
jgi:hypothetical protein